MALQPSVGTLCPSSHSRASEGENGSQRCSLPGVRLALALTPDAGSATRGPPVGPRQAGSQMQPVAYFTKFYWNTTALLYLPASVAASLQLQSLKRLLRAPKRKMSAAPWDSERWPPGLRYVVSNDTLGVVSRMKVDVWAKELKRSSRHILGAFHSECCAVTDPPRTQLVLKAW